MLSCSQSLTPWPGRWRYYARGECLAFRAYLERVLRNEAQIAAMFSGEEAFMASVDGQPVKSTNQRVQPDHTDALYVHQLELWPGQE